MKRLWIGLAAAVAWVPVAASAEQFRYRYRPGQVLRARTTLAGATTIGPGRREMGKGQFRSVVLQTMRVRSVEGDVVTLEVAENMVSGTATTLGQTEPYRQPATTSVVKMTLRGRFISRSLLKPVGEAPQSGPLQAADALHGLNFPARDLKPGDAWEDTVMVPGAAGTQQVRLRSRYLGRATFRGRACARFSTTLRTETASETHAPAPPEAASVPEHGRLTATMITYFDPAAGVEVYSAGSLVATAPLDLSDVSPGAGSLSSITRIDTTQTLVSGTGKGAGARTRRRGGRRRRR